MAAEHSPAPKFSPHRPIQWFDSPEEEKVYYEKLASVFLDKNGKFIGGKGEDDGEERKEERITLSTTTTYGIPDLLLTPRMREHYERVTAYYEEVRPQMKAPIPVWSKK